MGLDRLLKSSNLGVNWSFKSLHHDFWSILVLSCKKAHFTFPLLFPLPSNCAQFQETESIISHILEVEVL